MTHPRCNAQFFAEDLDRLPFAGKSFDLVFCDRFLSHAVDLDTVANDMLEMIKDGGSIVVFDVYSRKDGSSCSDALESWLGCRYPNVVLGESTGIFEEPGLTLSHFESMDEHLDGLIESAIWDSMLGSFLEGAVDSEPRLSQRDAFVLRRAIAEREIGYCAMLFKKDL